MRIKTIIIDDNNASINLLKKMLEDYFKNVELIASFNSVKESINAIENLNPELVFLDIEMPIDNGFILFEYFPKPLFETIFISAYDEYAVKAFRFDSIDYLVKPIDPSELRDALHKVVKKNELSRKNTNKTRSRIAIHSQSGIELISISKILYCKAHDNYSFVHTLDKKFLVSKPLKHFQTLLETIGFFRISRSHLVNINHIVSITGGRKSTAILINKTTISIGLARKKELMNLLKNQDIINMK